MFGVKVVAVMQQASTKLTCVESNWMEWKEKKVVEMAKQGTNSLFALYTQYTISTNIILKLNFVRSYQEDRNSIEWRRKDTKRIRPIASTRSSLLH